MLREAYNALKYQYIETFKIDPWNRYEQGTIPALVEKFGVTEDEARDTLGEYRHQIVQGWLPTNQAIQEFENNFFGDK